MSLIKVGSGYVSVVPAIVNAGKEICYREVRNANLRQNFCNYWPSVVCEDWIADEILHEGHIAPACYLLNLYVTK